MPLGVRAQVLQCDGACHYRCRGHRPP